MAPDADSQVGLRRSLGLTPLVLFGLVYIGQLVVFTTYGVVTQSTGGD
ncbi:MAG: hypothetical protein ACKOB8_04805 [Mycobacterium sp.]